MERLEYLLLIEFAAPPDPDDPRPLREQADEQIEGLCHLVADAMGGYAEPLSVVAYPRRAP